MRDFQNSLKSDIALEEQLLKMIQRELRTLPGGRLKLGKNSSFVYFKQEKAKEKDKAKLLPIDSPLATGIARRTYLERQLRILENNLRVQKPLLAKYGSYAYEHVLQKISKVYQLVDMNAREAVERKRENLQDLEMHSENLKHLTLKKELRRSKSEIIISMLYDSYRIPYSYEDRIYWPMDAPPEAWEIKKKLDIRDFYVPDFSFKLPDGRKKYHEHLGMMSNAGYMEDWKKKMILYFWAGVIPGDNLIITADDCKGRINQEEIVKIIESQLSALIGTAKSR